MVIECSYCESQVDAEVLACHEEQDKEEPIEYRISLTVCPVCKNALIAVQDSFDAPKGQEWGPATRVWPSPKKYISWSVPLIVRSSLEEAERCINAKAYTAAVTMCGCALEGICKHFKGKKQYLQGGIKELLEMGVIDERIFRWSEELRKHRNIAAHASEEKITKEDAADLQDFAIAISEYVFALTDKFNKFLARKAKGVKKDKKAQ